MGEKQCVWRYWRGIFQSPYGAYNLLILHNSLCHVLLIVSTTIWFVLINVAYSTVCGQALDSVPLIVGYLFNVSTRIRLRPHCASTVESRPP